MPSRRTKSPSSSAATAPSGGGLAVGRYLVAFAIVLVLTGMAVYLLMDAPAESDQPIALIPGPPPIQFEPASYDFGEMPLRTSRSETIRLRNASASQVRIVSARSSCACLRADLGPVVIEPRATIEMPIQINSLSTPGDATFTVSVMAAGYEDPAVFSVRRTTMSE